MGTAEEEAEAPGRTGGGMVPAAAPRAGLCSGASCAHSSEGAVGPVPILVY